MNYTKFSFKVFRGTGMNTIFYIFNFSILFPAIMICFFSIMSILTDSKDSSSIYLMTVLLAGMMPSSLAELVNRHPVFYGAEKDKPKPMTGNTRPENMIHLLPFSREEIVRSFVKCSLFAEIATFIPMMLFSVCAVMQSFNTAVTIISSFAFMWAAGYIALLNRSLAHYNMKRITPLVNLVWSLLLIVFSFSDSIGTSDFNIPVISVIFGAATMLAAIISAVTIAKSQMQLIRDCKNRSASGEPIDKEA